MEWLENRVLVATTSVEMQVRCMFEEMWLLQGGRWNMEGLKYNLAGVVGISVGTASTLAVVAPAVPMAVS